MTADNPATAIVSTVEIVTRLLDAPDEDARAEIWEDADPPGMLVVDWKSHDDEIVADAVAALGVDGPVLEVAVRDGAVHVRHGERRFVVPPGSVPGGLDDMLPALARALRPDHEFRQLDDSGGDTRIFMALPIDDWRRLEASHGARRVAAMFEPLGPAGHPGGCLSVPFARLWPRSTSGR